MKFKKCFFNTSTKCLESSHEIAFKMYQFKKNDAWIYLNFFFRNSCTNFCKHSFRKSFMILFLDIPAKRLTFLQKFTCTFPLEFFPIFVPVFTPKFMQHFLQGFYFISPRIFLKGNSSSNSSGNIS